MTPASALMAQRLDREYAVRAFPLVQSIRADLSLEEWLEYVDKTTLGNMVERGIVAAVNARGYVEGLFCFEVEDDLIHGKVLNVDNFVSVDLYGRNGATDLLLAEMDRVATQAGCKALHITMNEGKAMLPRACTSTFGRLREAGMKIDAVRLCKTV